MASNAKTEAITIPARREEVFAFLAEPVNLPRWAVGFARAVRQEDDRWIVQTAGGDVPVRFVTDEDRGTIDFHMSVAPDVEVVAHSRVVPNGEGSEYVFTQFQGPGMTDEAFAAQCAALAEELALLAILFRAQAFCPTGAQAAGVAEMPDTAHSEV